MQVQDLDDCTSLQAVLVTGNEDDAAASPMQSQLHPSPLPKVADSATDSPSKMADQPHRFTFGSLQLSALSPASKELDGNKPSSAWASSSSMQGTGIPTVDLPSGRLSTSAAHNPSHMTGMAHGASAVAASNLSLASRQLVSSLSTVTHRLTSEAGALDSTGGTGSGAMLHGLGGPRPGPRHLSVNFGNSALRKSPAAHTRRQSIQLQNSSVGEAQQADQLTFMQWRERLQSRGVHTSAMWVVDREQETAEVVDIDFAEQSRVSKAQPSGTGVGGVDDSAGSPSASKQQSAAWLRPGRLSGLSSHNATGGLGLDTGTGRSPRLRISTDLSQGRAASMAAQMASPRPLPSPSSMSTNAGASSFVAGAGGAGMGPASPLSLDSDHGAADTAAATALWNDVGSAAAAARKTARVRVAESFRVCRALSCVYCGVESAA